MKRFDIIGDVHGYATALKVLLKKLGYRKVKNTYRHDKNRMVLFLGDYIDRGLEEESTCNIVRSMVESGDALAIQGNHEYNAICFATEYNGQYLRTHNKRNIKTHESFLKEYPLGSKKHKDIISWFKTLPLFLELDDLRAVHACWHKDSIDFLKNNLNSNIMTDEFIIESSLKGSKSFNAIESCLKGLEMNLPNNQTWKDSLGIERNTMRINWFKEQDVYTVRNIAMSMPKSVVLPDKIIKEKPYIYNDKKTLFFGHYWMNGVPEKQTDYVACLDYSIAKNGKLVAYRFDGESKIDNRKFVY